MAANSQVVANAMLGVLGKAPKEVLSAHPHLMERAIAVMLNLHQAEGERGRGGEAESADNISSNIGGDYTLPFAPHRGVYGQLIAIAGKAGMLQIVLSLHENMVSEAELYPTIFTETCLLTALGDCKEYDMAHTLYDAIEGAAADEVEGAAFGRVNVKTISKYMEICYASDCVGRGLQAFKNWSKMSSERPTWYCYQVLYSLAKAKAKAPLTRRGPLPASPAPPQEEEREGEVHAWNPQGHWSEQRVRKEQGEAVKTVTQAVVDSLYKPHQRGEAPLALLASDIGCHLVLTGHLDTLVATRLRDGKDVQVARCWTTIAYLLEEKGRWRDLVSLAHRVCWGHQDLPASTRLIVTSHAVSSLSNDDNGGGGESGRVTWLWDEHMPRLLKEVATKEQGFRYQLLFMALTSKGKKGSGLVPAALLLALEAGVAHPKLLPDALWNCRDGGEVLLSLEAYSQFHGENQVQAAVKGKAVSAAIGHVSSSLSEEDRKELEISLKSYYRL